MRRGGILFADCTITIISLTCSKKDYEVGVHEKCSAKFMFKRVYNFECFDYYNIDQK